jgi:hypothetical protein
MSASQLFDQDAFARPEETHVVACHPCRVGNCADCSSSGCICLHPFAVVGRAIIELSSSVDRTSQLLGELGQERSAS